jgi:hypothetical protein
LTVFFTPAVPAKYASAIFDVILNPLQSAWVKGNTRFQDSNRRANMDSGKKICIIFLLAP